MIQKIIKTIFVFPLVLCLWPVVVAFTASSMVLMVLCEGIGVIGCWAYTREEPAFSDLLSGWDNMYGMLRNTVLFPYDFLKMVWE